MPPTHPQSCIKETQHKYSADPELSTVNQTRDIEEIIGKLNERESIEQIGSNSEILFLLEKEENQESSYQTVVFLPELVQTNSFLNLAQLTQPVLSEQTIESSTSTYVIAPSLDLHHFVQVQEREESLWSPSTTLQAQIHQGELNTPVIDKLKGFNFDITTETTTTISKGNKDVLTDQSRNIAKGINQHQQEEKVALEFNSVAHFKILQDNNHQQQTKENEFEKEEERIPYYNNFQELLQDEQMFRLDQDSQVFVNSEDLDNNFEELGTILSDDYIPPLEDIGMFNELYFNNNNDMMDSKKNIEEDVIPVDIEPSVPVQAEPTIKLKLQIPTIPTISEQKQQQQFSTEVTQAQAPAVKMEEENFDLVNFIDSNEFTELTPFEEKSCPNFEVKPSVIIEIKQEPSTSAAPSRKVSVATDISDHQYELSRPRRVIKKRRYSSDSDFSVGTSASSYNSTRQRIHKRKRGRPAKELITVLPTIEDFKDLPAERASHLVLRIKNNEASRKSRMKSKNQQEALEDECSRLERRQNLLKTTRDKLDGQIETLRKWLLGEV